MKKTIFTFAFLAFTFSIFATAQAPDIIIYKGQTYSLFSNPLEEYFDKNPEKKPHNEVMSTGLWRGYIATFEIIDNQLFLIKIQVERTINDSLQWVNVLNEVFPDEEKVKVYWETGLLVIPYGELINYVHMGYGSTYSNYILLEITAGNLTKEEQFDARGYEEFKTRQFQAFKETDEYKELKNRMKQEADNWSDKEIDSFIRNFIIRYTTKILK